MVSLPLNEQGEELYSDLAKRWYARQLWSIGWDGISARFAYLEPHSVPVDLVSREDTISLHVGGNVKLERQHNGRWKSGHSYPGNLSLSPRQVPQSWRFEGSSASCLYLHSSPDLLMALAGDAGRGDPTRAEIIENFNIRDPFIEQIGLVLLSELHSGGLAGRVYVETLAQTLGLHLLRHYSPVVIHSLPDTGRLSSGQLDKAKALIEDGLHQDISLKEMAAAADLSPWHFARLFKKTTGRSPYQYLMQRRVERAKWLLLDGRHTLEEVAELAGFKNLIHLTHHFKTLLGVTPQTVARQGRRLLS